MDNITFNQALHLWSELWMAYYGKNGYGGNTAKIYVYTLMPYTPAIYTSDDAFGEYKQESGLQAAWALQKLLAKFNKEYSCKIFINGIDLIEWKIEPLSHLDFVEIQVIARINK